MSTVKEIVKLMSDLPEELQAEVRDFARFVKDTRIRRPHGKMKLDWRGALSDMRNDHTSVELQHEILEWRIEAALDGCPSAEAIRRELHAASAGLKLQKRGI